MAFHHHKQIAGLTCSVIEKAVLNAFANYADAKGVCWPSQTTLAMAAGVCERSVRNAVSSLVKKGWLRVTHTQTSNRYALTLPAGSSCLSEGNQVPVQAAPHADEHTKEKIKEPTIESGVTIVSAGCEHIKPSKYQQGMTAEEAIKIIQGKGKPPAKTNKVSVASMEALFKELLLKNFDSCKFVASFTVKERGQMAQFIKKVGPENAVGCMTWAMENWWWYVGTCDIKVKPTYPSPGFLLQHCNMAMSGLITDQEKEKAKAEAAAKEAAKPVEKPKAVKAPEPKYVSNIATLEDLEAILAGTYVEDGEGGSK